MSGLVHNHGAEDGPGLACPEVRDAAGSLRGACVDRASTLTVPDPIKMIRETLCVAQGAILARWTTRTVEHMDRLQRLIDDCDRQRPLGPDGKHDDRHTPTCGCDLP